MTHTRSREQQQQNKLPPTTEDLPLSATTETDPSPAAEKKQKKKTKQHAYYAQPDKSAGVDIMIDISIFSAAQMSKEKRAHGSPTTTWFKINSTEPWSTFKAQILTKISDILDPTKLDFDDYNITFTIQCHSTNPLPLANAEDLNILVTRALKMKADPTTKVLVEGKPKQKQPKVSLIPQLCSTIDVTLQPKGKVYNDDDDGDDEQSDKDDDRKKKKGSKILYSSGI
ncbi:uncharacterized protein ARMOST_16177 [Armillaria ostoyae]|uniref:Uncharacterized protein n=1 Tax=Armillaria ostoyae TaxID=47428 RepID=A0A284RVG4_ARMOS|nr:uncharacterized protein ARMOST_16177 [Armillaria ostoyae]